MKKILIAAAAAALLSTPALADSSANQVITISGSAPNVCTLGNPAQQAVTGNIAVSGSNVTITGLFNTNDATLAAGSVTLRFAGMCNYAHNIQLRSANGYLYNTTGSLPPLGGEFVRRVGYAADYSWAGQTRTGAISDQTSTTTAGSAGGNPQTSTALAIGGANAGDLDVKLNFAANTNPVVAGNYSDTLTVRIGAAF